MESGRENAEIQRQIEGEENEEEEELLQSKQADSQIPAVTPAIERRIYSLRGNGSPLSKSERNFFEPRFGRDLSNVKIHTDSRAAATALSLNSKAFTIGNDIVFASGHYSPASDEGKKLIAHELTHTIQQGKNVDKKIQRRVRRRFVSCRNPSAATRRLVGDDPVDTIRLADSFAIVLADSAIDRLTRLRQSAIQNLQSHNPLNNVIPACVANVLRNNFGLTNPFEERIWRGRGARTVHVIIRRLQAALRLLEGGWLRYTCIGPARLNFTSGKILYSDTCCTGGVLACAFAGITRIWLCRPWWHDSLTEQALTLIHEALHIYFSIVRDTTNFAAAENYIRMVECLTGT